MHQKAAKRRRGFTLASPKVKKHTSPKHESSRISNLLYKSLFCNHLGFGCQLAVVRRTTINWQLITI
jgi:hypothetical protein